MESVLITGATGFIGRACLEILANHYFTIHAIFNKRPTLNYKNITWHQCDLLNTEKLSELIKKIRPDYLIHLAWFVEHDNFWKGEENLKFIDATVKLYLMFSNHGKKAIFLGTGYEYEKINGFCHEATTSLKPKTLYGLCKKHCFELIAKLKEDNPQYANFTWVRLFHIYGPHENQNRIIPYIFLNYLQQKPLILKTPYAVRDYIYVEEAAELLINFLGAETPAVINIGSGHLISIIDLAKKIHGKFFNNQPLILNNENIEKDNFAPDLNSLSKIRQLPIGSLDKNLENMYQWIKVKEISSVS